MVDASSQLNILQIVDSHYQSLYRYAYRLSGSIVDSEDLTQETFCKAQLQLNQLRDVNRIKPWLFSILRNLFLQRCRSNRQESLVSLNSLEALHPIQNDQNSNKQGIIELENGKEINSDQLGIALGRLPELYRIVVLMYYFEDLSYRNIAEQLELPIGTVMSRLARAKSFLKSELHHHDSLNMNSLNNESRSRDAQNKEGSVSPPENSFPENSLKRIGDLSASMNEAKMETIYHNIDEKLNLDEKVSLDLSQEKKHNQDRLLHDQQGLVSTDDQEPTSKVKEG